MRNDIIQANGDIEKLASTKWSEDVYYYHLTWATLADLPNIIRENQELLNHNPWEISDILEWLFITQSYQDLSWNLTKEDLEWFTFFRLNDKEEVSIKNATKNINKRWYCYAE